MRKVKRLSDFLEFLEDRGIDSKNVLIDPRAIEVVEDEEDDLDEEE